MSLRVTNAQDFLKVEQELASLLVALGTTVNYLRWVEGEKDPLYDEAESDTYDRTLSVPFRVIEKPRPDLLTSLGVQDLDTELVAYTTLYTLEQAGITANRRDVIQWDGRYFRIDNIIEKGLVGTRKVIVYLACSHAIVKETQIEEASGPTHSFYPEDIIAGRWLDRDGDASFDAFASISAGTFKNTAASTVTRGWTYYYLDDELDGKEGFFFSVVYKPTAIAGFSCSIMQTKETGLFLVEVTDDTLSFSISLSSGVQTVTVPGVVVEDAEYCLSAVSYKGQTRYLVSSTETGEVIAEGVEGEQTDGVVTAFSPSALTGARLDIFSNGTTKAFIGVLSNISVGACGSDGNVLSSFPNRIAGGQGANDTDTYKNFMYSTVTSFEGTSEFVYEDEMNFALMSSAEFSARYSIYAGTFVEGQGLVADGVTGIFVQAKTTGVKAFGIGPQAEIEVDVSGSDGTGELTAGIGSGLLTLTDADIVDGTLSGNASTYALGVVVVTYLGTAPVVVGAVRVKPVNQVYGFIGNEPFDRTTVNTNSYAPAIIDGWAAITYSSSADDVLFYYYNSWMAYMATAAVIEVYFSGVRFSATGGIAFHLPFGEGTVGTSEGIDNPYILVMETTDYRFELSIDEEDSSFVDIAEFEAFEKVIRVHGRFLYKDVDDPEHKYKSFMAALPKMTADSYHKQVVLYIDTEGDIHVYLGEDEMQIMLLGDLNLLSWDGVVMDLGLFFRSSYGPTILFDSRLSLSAVAALGENYV